MAKIVTIQGANHVDELERLAALEQLNQMPTIVIKRLAELSKNGNAVKKISNSILFETLKALANR